MSRERKERKRTGQMRLKGRRDTADITAVQVSCKALVISILKL